MLVSTATREFERWVGGQIPLVRDLLAAKHKKMEQDRLKFQGACYRWAQIWPQACPFPVWFGICLVRVSEFQYDG